MAVAAVTAASTLTGFAASLTVTSQSLVGLKTCTLSGYPATATAESGSYVDQNAATSNFATGNAFQVRSDTTKNQRFYIQFDLTQCSPAIPSTATVKTATLRLFLNSILSASCRTLDVFRVTSAWASGTLTWNNQPFGTTLNNPASATRTDLLTAGTGAGCTNVTNNVYVTGWSVTADVQAFVSGSASNRGWMVRDDTEGGTGLQLGFAAGHLGNAAQSPQLIVIYR